MERGKWNASAADRELVLRFQRGDEAAYEDIFRHYSARVERICTRMMANHQDAEEALQETFLRAYQNLPRFNGSYQLGAWLARIATNVCLDSLRKRRRTTTRMYLTPEVEAVEDGSDPQTTITTSEPEIAVTIASLKPIHARALHLRVIEGMSHQEMAGRLKMTPSQVKALLHRARTSFKRVWNEAQGFVTAPIASLRLGTARWREASDPWFSSPTVTLAAEKVVASALVLAVAMAAAPAGSEAPAGGGTDDDDARPTLVVPQDKRAKARGGSDDVRPPRVVPATVATTDEGANATSERRKRRRLIASVVRRVPRPPLGGPEEQGGPDPDRDLPKPPSPTTVANEEGEEGEENNPVPAIVEEIEPDSLLLDD